MNLLLARFIRTKSITFIELYKTCPDSELKVCARTYAYLQFTWFEVTTGYADSYSILHIIMTPRE